jgi:hypothetical protein
MDYKFHATLAIMAASFKEVADIFALTEEQMHDPAAGKWIVDRIRQMQTAHTLREEIAKKIDFQKAQATPLPEE